MFKTIIWDRPRPLKELELIQLPKTFFFVLDYVDGVLCAKGLSSSLLGIQWAELKMVNEGF